MTDFEPNEHEGHDVADERHRAGCAGCAAAWADLERISAEARALPALSPSRDLWAGIDARIAERVPMRDEERAGVATTAAVPPRLSIGRRRRIAQAVRLATAASLLVTATATVTWQLATNAAASGSAELPLVADVSTASMPQPDLGDAFGVPTSTVGAAQQASLDHTVRTMDREITELQQLVDERRASFDPRTIAVLEQNLKVIDAAIDESRKALAADPASRFLAAQYARAYTSKLTLLRGAATLPAGD